MKTRTVSHLLYAEKMDMGGFPVRQPFPTNQVQQFDPFLLLHHADVPVSKTKDLKHAGVGPHPHRGFSPVTFIFQGGVHHRDSRGNNSIIYAGGAQWINAGRGIIHSERPPHDIHEHGGRQEIIQLWINTPSKSKMDLPAYYPVATDEAGQFISSDGKVTARVFAGTMLGQAGPIPTTTEINAATLEFKSDGEIAIDLPENHNAFLYLLKGSLHIEGYGAIEPLNAVLFKRDGNSIMLSTKTQATVLLMSGLPLNEPVVSHGPFVMNTETQILEAMRDYQMGKMGVLIED